MKRPQKVEQNIEFRQIIEEIISNEKVKEMKKYIQHGKTNCYQHCYEVAYYCFCICKKVRLDYKSATRAAMVHDMFLYDWHNPKSHKRWHGFRHPKIACKIACQEFDLSKKEQDMIKKHMWPLTIIPPKSMEGFILTLVDKYCTIKEFFNKYR